MHYFCLEEYPARTVSPTVRTGWRCCGDASVRCGRSFFGLILACFREGFDTQEGNSALRSVPYHLTPTPLHEQACISRSARGAVWGVLTCLFVLSRYKGPKIFFACGAPRIPLEISKETVFPLQCLSFGPGAVLGDAYMLVRGHACSCMRVLMLNGGSGTEAFGFDSQLPERRPRTTAASPL